MKKVILPAIAILFFATACEKKEITQPTLPGNTISNNHTSQRKFVDFNYTIHRDATTGEYSCPTPKSDCSKISPDPSRSFGTINTAIANHTVTAFFNSTGWEESFPYLDGQASVVAGLKSGEYNMVCRTNSAGEILYIVIPSTDNTDSFTTAVYTTLVTK
ncbi:hypothetical protein BH11BAC7_BH11BAC7_15450 [soil metagenome]